MKILVTGGAGLIGSNVVRFLIESGLEVIVGDNLWRGSIDNLKWSTKDSVDLQAVVYKYDLKDYKKCLELTRDIDAVIHLADIVAGINFVFSNELFVFRSNNLINSNV